MQDRTINNALIEIAKQGGHQGKLADVLLDMRGVGWSGITQIDPMKRGGTRRFILTALKPKPMSSWELGGLIREARPEIGRRAAGNRAYQALRRMEDDGLVVRDGRVWRLAQWMDKTV